MFKHIIKNWKTSLSATLIAILTGLLASGTITIEQFQVILGILSSIGFYAAKDFNISGMIQKIFPDDNH